MFKIFIFYYCATLLIKLGSAEVSTIKKVTDFTAYNSLYYDPISGDPLTGYLKDSNRISNSTKIHFKSLPCACANFVCSCCTGINITVIKFDRHICTNLTYHAQEFALQMHLLMDDKEIFSNQISAKYPPPVCIPMPYVPFIGLCIRLYEIHTVGRNLHVCVDFETRIIRAPILVLHFDCIRMGTDGIVWLKPEKGSVPPKPQNTIHVTDSYDVVNFESEDGLPVENCTTIFPLGDEDLIGQLKL